MDCALHSSRGSFTQTTMWSALQILLLHLWEAFPNSLGPQGSVSSVDTQRCYQSCLWPQALERTLPQRIRILARKSWGSQMIHQGWTKKGALIPQVKPSHLNSVEPPTENHSKGSWANGDSAIGQGNQNGCSDTTSPFVWRETADDPAWGHYWVSQGTTARVPCLDAEARASPAHLFQPPVPSLGVVRNWV